MGKKKYRPHEQGEQTRKEMLAYIVKHKREHDGNSPSNREIIAHTSVTSTSVIHWHLSILEQEGVIKLRGGARNIEIVGGYRNYRV